jgi:NADPH-dependent ferric siderophore reductase
MPELPSLFADLVERRFAQSARVLAIQIVAPRLRRVRFRMASAINERFRPGDEVELVGCSASVAELRNLLARKLGVPRRAVRAKAYWAPDRRGL